MNKNTIIVIGVIVVILLAALLLISTRKDERQAAPPPPPAAAPPPAAVETPSAGEQIVEITAGGFSPSTLTISSGTTIRFTNRDANPHWPASGVHPVHQVCPGFDSLKPLQRDESYLFTFTESKTCPMHDHLNPSLRGSITVE